VINSGYVAIYVMVETEENTGENIEYRDYYHEEHGALYHSL